MFVLFCSVCLLLHPAGPPAGRVPPFSSHATLSSWTIQRPLLFYVFHFTLNPHPTFLLHQTLRLIYLIHLISKTNLFVDHTDLLSPCATSLLSLMEKFFKSAFQGKPCEQCRWGQHGTEEWPLDMTGHEWSNADNPCPQQTAESQGESLSLSSAQLCGQKPGAPFSGHGITGPDSTGAAGQTQGSW